ncbi:MAG: hypothetical protein ABL963_16765 [Longimicrobiales bacterium]
MMDSLFPLIAGVITGSLGFAAWYATRRRRGDGARRVEAPNSHHSSRGVQERNDRERWGSIDLGGLHPVNRDEVHRLLALADARGVGLLSSKERAFLDNMSRPRRGS